MEARSRSGCGRGVLIAAGLLVVLTTAIGVLVALNWPKVSAVYRGAIGTLAELRTVQTALQKRYDTPQVFVMAKRQSGVQGSILSIRLVNPPFLKGLGEDDLEDKALEIAAAARNTLRHRDGYENYEVVLTRQAGLGVTVSTNRRFTFSIHQLPQ